MTIAWYDIIGIIGVICVLAAYALLQLKRMQAHGFAFPAINLLGSVLILVSLYFKPNLSAILIEAAWAIISLFGIGLAWKSRNSSKEEN